ncbi:GspE/PulE family protein [Candidatus Magnetomoraceae bacterium gMMP-1]
MADIKLASKNKTGLSIVPAQEQDARYRKQLLEITNLIHSATELDEILIDIKDQITSVFEAERITIYVLDGRNRELVSRLKSGSEKSEIRVPVSINSIAGYAASEHTIVNVKDAYDKQELAAIDPTLGFDSTWDKKTGFRTKQVLVVPITFKKYILGALQLINRTDGTSFSDDDEQAVDELARTIGIALYNQKRSLAAKKTPATKFDYLLENNIISSKDLNRAITSARERKESVDSILINDLKVPKKEIGTSLSNFYKTPFVEYNSRVPIPGDLLAHLKVPFMRNNVWVPLKMEDDKIIIAIDNPNDLQRIDEVSYSFADKFSDKKLEFHIALKEDILKFIDLFTQDEKELGSIEEILQQLQTEEDEIEDAESLIDEEDNAVVMLVNKIILDSYARGASDIHIEPLPGKENTLVRIRVDGSCAIYQTVPYTFRNAVVSRLKIMADLDIADKRKPQDGKIKFKKYGGKDIELRVATIPTQGGLEDVVMRILAAGEPIPLDKMGFSKRNHKNFVDCVTKPYGLIFVAGPTGSGKTTTLHSALGYINKPDIKIWTAEDPVEITQKGLRQVQVQSKIGFDFAAAMRAFLRADPDVIMVGEMRDKETTHIGIEASLTGHLVFSTLHTNSAPESITRLLDMGMDPFNFADAVLCILAQRLGRTLCSDCKEAYNPSKKEYDEIVYEYEPEAFEKNLNIPYSKDLILYKAKGCERCNNTGYRGRMGLHELLMGTDDMKKLIQTRAPMEQLRDQAINDGMTTLKQDGIEKIFSGHLDLLQVRKVCIK